MLFIDLPKDNKQRKSLVQQKVVQLLASWTDTSFAKVPRDGRSNEDVKRKLRQLASACVEFTQVVDRKDFLFGEIFDRFKAHSQHGVFLESLEPFILQDKLKFLNPEVMQLLVEHYRQTGMLRNVEQCIIHLEIASLDFHQVL